MPLVILGDEACPLKTINGTFREKEDLSCEERVFHYGLSRGRRCIECAFRILTAKWRLSNKQYKRKSITLKEQCSLSICCLPSSQVFDIYCSVHRNILWNNQQMRQCAVKFISLQVHSTCFGRYTRPSSGVQS